LYQGWHLLQKKLHLLASSQYQRLCFRDNEAAYLAGVAAANETKTNKVGFVGGEEGVVIDRFQAGFEKGVADPLSSRTRSMEDDINAVLVHCSS
jgi:hypothetical protein